MRKKTVSHVADTVFWYLIYFFPVICYLVFLLAEPSTSTTVINFEMFFSSAGLGFTTDNIIYSGLNSVFGVGGTLPLFSSNAISALVEASTVLLSVCG